MRDGNELTDVIVFDGLHNTTIDETLNHDYPRPTTRLRALPFSHTFEKRADKTDKVDKHLMYLRLNRTDNDKGGRARGKIVRLYS